MYYSLQIYRVLTAFFYDNNIYINILLNLNMSLFFFWVLSLFLLSKFPKKKYAFFPLIIDSWLGYKFNDVDIITFCSVIIIFVLFDKRVEKPMRKL